MSEFEVQNKSQILYFNDVAKQFEPIYEYGSSKYIVTKNGNGRSEEHTSELQSLE